MCTTFFRYKKIRACKHVRRNFPLRPSLPHLIHLIKAVRSLRKKARKLEPEIHGENSSRKGFPDERNERVKGVKSRQDFSADSAKETGRTNSTVARLAAFLSPPVIYNFKLRHYIVVIFAYRLILDLWFSVTAYKSCCREINEQHPSRV